jgi:hypothetical protein
MAKAVSDIANKARSAGRLQNGQWGECIIIKSLQYKPYSYSYSYSYFSEAHLLLSLHHPTRFPFQVLAGLRPAVGFSLQPGLSINA